MIPLLYEGSVKNVRGPVWIEGKVGSRECVVFEYTDAYSVFDWGRMPDALPGKGASLAVIAADLFEKLARPTEWQEFSRSKEAQALRKASRFGAEFIEVGEGLQRTGLRTHLLGALGGSASVEEVAPRALAECSAPPSALAVERVSVVKPRATTVLGRAVPDYTETRRSLVPRLVPLEVVFRFGCPSGSSLIERAGKNPDYMASIGFGGLEVSPGSRWDFPVLEVFTKLESTDRPLPLQEALAISGIEGEQLATMLYETAWVAGFLRWKMALCGLELADGKLEWGVAEDGRCLLVDAIGPDELRILKDGIQLSKEFLRGFYRKTAWYEAVGRAKEQAQERGVADWKRLVTEAPPSLPSERKELAGQLYQALANEITGKKWFPSAWTLERVMKELKA